MRPPAVLTARSDWCPSMSANLLFILEESYSHLSCILKCLVAPSITSVVSVGFREDSRDTVMFSYSY